MALLDIELLRCGQGTARFGLCALSTLHRVGGCWHPLERPRQCGFGICCGTPVDHGSVRRSTGRALLVCNEPSRSSWKSYWNGVDR